MQLIFATNNAHKVMEVREILQNTGITVVTLAEAGLELDPPETGDTFQANALQKAHYVQQHTGGWVVADDSGLTVDALEGAPGVHSKRFSPQATAASNNILLLERLREANHRTARFQCVIAVVGPDVERTAEGSVEGTIATVHQGEDGFGYDPLFLPNETPGLSMAQLSLEQKNAISHRGRAFRLLPGLLP